MRGIMIWFNEEKDLGAIRTDDGERIEVPGSAFVDGGKPVGRCAGKPVEFELVDGSASGVALVEDDNPRRARMRHRR